MFLIKYMTNMILSFSNLVCVHVHYLQAFMVYSVRCFCGWNFLYLNTGKLKFISIVIKRAIYFFYASFSECHKFKTTIYGLIIIIWTYIYTYTHGMCLLYNYKNYFYSTIIFVFPNSAYLKQQYINHCWLNA